MDKPRLRWVFARDWLWLIPGVALGCLAWGEGRLPVMAVLLPVAIAASPSRKSAFALALGYLMGAQRGGPAYIGSWFDQSYTVGTALWLSSCLLGAAGWSLGWTAVKAWPRRGLSMSAAWLVTLLPPLAITSFAHPLVAWGYLLPGWGWFGVIASLAAPVFIVWLREKFILHRVHQTVSLTVVILALSAMSWISALPDTRTWANVVAVSTQWGKVDSPLDVVERIERMGKIVGNLAQENLAAVVIFPESVIQTYDPALFPVLDYEVLQPARRANMTVVIGMDLPLANGRLQTVAAAMYPDGKTAIAASRQPAPVALWKPWAPESFEASWFAPHVLALQDGVRARFVFCYEEYIPILFLISEFGQKVDLVVVQANTWAAESSDSSGIQTAHSLGMAKLFGRPLLKAENRPRVRS